MGVSVTGIGGGTGSSIFGLGAATGVASLLMFLGEAAPSFSLGFSFSSGTSTIGGGGWIFTSISCGMISRSMTRIVPEMLRKA